MRRLLELTMALDRMSLGTEMAAAFVDDDGTATVHLLRRTVDGWLNLTACEEEALDPLEMAERYDDVVLTRFGKDDE